MYVCSFLNYARVFFYMQVPLWVCPDCRRNIEEEERRAALEPSSPSNFQVHHTSPKLIYFKRQLPFHFFRNCKNLQSTINHDKVFKQYYYEYCYDDDDGFCY